MGRFHRLPQLDHPNLIQRKAISGGCPGRGYENTHPPLPTHTPRFQGPRQDERASEENCPWICPQPCPCPENCFLELSFSQVGKLLSTHSRLAPAGS